ncbi:B3 domain-containing protein Os06g0194400-like [Hordeum vulgare subsp. vulgare]|uniref:B3 domain-containing protein Os06g0194400-like n=1 Tax=Hordeum vulgare subsp. vulgare TaxID=112509 RepID=UPI000B488B40|nr:B3 domain-containing protein Os06g0194400-like [Hordeum vulgare subsp. vulgare]XP_044945755.1 B3 domain-containing protein Os06g0194400-like [Hordeum vulgare subsp. vulgare]
MAESNSYEEQRRRQIEENRRKLEELRVHHLSAAVREAAARPKPKPKPRPKPKAPEPGELRRSGRVASLPEQPNYLNDAEQRDYRGVYEAYAVRKGPTDEQRAGAIAKAEELRRRIHRSRCPAFVKPMSHSLAINEVHMRIPRDFRKYLPAAHGEAVVVVDEADDEFHMMYNAYKKRCHYLEKGWKGFAFDHDLVDGDCLVFHMTERAKFKVYIFRANPDYKSDQTFDESEDEE